MFLTILKLVLVSLIPVGCSVIFMALRLYSKFGKWSRPKQNAIISVVFSITCILGTVLSVKTSTGAAANIRDASPIIAGLIFGGPCGIISGVVGGLFRFVAAYWDSALKTTQIACSIATCCAGFLTAFVRKFIFNNHHGRWYYGCFIALLVEDFHMLLVFLTYFNDTKTAYKIINSTITPMVLANTLAVCVASIIACVMAKEKILEKPTKNVKLTTKIQLSLVGLLLVAYTSVSLFSYKSEYSTARKNIQSNFVSSVTDLKGSVDIQVDNFCIAQSVSVADKIDIRIDEIELGHATQESLATYVEELKNDYQVSEINIVGTDNFIKYSTVPSLINFNMGDPANAQAYEFTCLNKGTKYYVQEFRAPSSDPTTKKKYTGAAFQTNTIKLGYVQICYYMDSYYKLLESEVKDCATFRRIEQKGFMAVTDSKDNVVSISKQFSDVKLIDSKILPENNSNKTFDIQLNGVDYSFFTYQENTEGYNIIAFADAKETMEPAKITFVGISLAQVFVFMSLYCILYIVIKKTVTNRIENIGAGLQKISSGDLNVRIDEKNSVEMIELSNNINKTVDSLKEFARKEHEKNAEELRFAKMIQHSVLPTVFPLNEKFEIFASMDTAKEVGGDFYDFFFVDPEHVAIVIADVSGKGVPAALFMMQAKTIIKNLVESGIPVNEVFTEANHRLCETNEAQMFVTAWLGVVDLRNGHVEYVNAGHNPPVICGENGEFIYLRSRSGFVLGGLDGFKYQMQSFDIVPGQKVFLYTDGVTEAMNKNQEQFGEEQLLTVINTHKTRGAHTVCDRVRKAVEKHVDGEEQSDDITMLCFGLIAKESTDAIVVDAKIENVASITEYVNKLLDEHGCEKKAKMELDVAIDEIFSNICYYAYKPDQRGKAKIVVDFDNHNHVILIFEDRGIAYNPLTKTDPNSKVSLEERQIGGLGIFIVKKTMDAMEYKNVNGHNVLKLKKTIK